MAVSVSKRRPRSSKKTELEKTEKDRGHHRSFCPSIGNLCSSFLYRVPLAALLLFIVYVWSSSSTIVSSNGVHICISSRKLNDLYCISAGSRPGFHVPVAGDSLKPVGGEMKVEEKSLGQDHSDQDQKTEYVKEENLGSVPGQDQKTEYVMQENLGSVPGQDQIKTEYVEQENLGSVPGQDHSDQDQKTEYVKQENLGSVPGQDQKTEYVKKENLGSVPGQDDKSSNDSGDSGAKNKNLDLQSDWDFESGDEQYRYIKSKNEDEESALKAVDKYLKLQRSWNKNGGHSSGSCEGNGIYVYDLPSKFNKDLFGECGDMVPWASFCSYFKNDAFGEPIESLGKGWYRTHQYSLEPIFHSRILKHPCRVLDEDSAKLFYVPFYGGLDVLRWHFKNVSEDVKDSLGIEVVKWLGSKRSWRRKSGKDHVFVLGKISWDFRRYDKFSWGSRFLELQEMQNPTKLVIERNPWQVNDVAVPHPTYFHPKTDDDIAKWQIKIISKPRRSLVSFAGGARPGKSENIRSTLIEQCKSFPDEKCRFLNCSDGGCEKPESIINMFQESEFCLQPPGDSPTRRSVFDSLISGCIPVIFDPYSAYYQYTWYLPEDHRRYSVYIRKDEVKEGGVNVVEKLMEKSVKEREDMRSYIVHELLPSLLYGHSDAKFERFRDAFDITISSLLEKVKTL